MIADNPRTTRLTEESKTPFNHFSRPFLPGTINWPEPAVDFFAAFGRKVIDNLCDHGVFEIDSISVGLLPLKKIISIQQAYKEQSWSTNSLGSS
jgi:hypothetical protein